MEDYYWIVEVDVDGVREQVRIDDVRTKRAAMRAAAAMVVMDPLVPARRIDAVTAHAVADVGCIYCRGEEEPTSLEGCECND